MEHTAFNVNNKILQNSFILTLNLAVMTMHGCMLKFSYISFP